VINSEQRGDFMNMIVRLLAVSMIALAFAGCVAYGSPYDESYYDYNYPSGSYYGYPSGSYYGYPSGSYFYHDRSGQHDGKGRHHRDRDDRHDGDD